MSLVHNARTKQLEALLSDKSSGYESNFSLEQAEILRKIYAAEHAHWSAVNHAQHEGVFEITLRTRTGTIVVPVSIGTGTEIVGIIQEELGDKLMRLERETLSHLINAESEADDAAGTSDRAEVFALCMPQGAATMKALPTESNGRRQAEAAA